METPRRTPLSRESTPKKTKRFDEVENHGIYEDRNKQHLLHHLPLR